MLAVLKDQVRRSDTGEMEFSTVCTVDCRVPCYRELIEWRQQRAERMYGRKLELEYIEHPQPLPTEGRTPMERAKNNIALCGGIGVETDTRPYYLRHVLRQAKTPEEFWRTFNLIWNACDAAEEVTEEIVEMCRNHLPGRSPEFMDAENRAFFEALPDPVKVWRGCSRDYVMEPSWSTDSNVAERFAANNRFHKIVKPTLASATIAKSAIFAVFSGGEREVFLDPWMLDNVSAKPWRRFSASAKAANAARKAEAEAERAALEAKWEAEKAEKQ